MAIDILVVEDEYTERQELTQLLETVTPPEHIRSAATCSAAIAAISQLCPGSDPAGYHAAGQLRL